jgi:hypothetical protein
MAVLVLQDGAPLDRKRRKTYIYAARIVKNGEIKIGISADVHRRLSLLRAERGSRVELIGVTPGARINERLAHRVLATSNSRGEYFNDTPQVQGFIKSYLLPAERFGLQVKCSQREFGLIERDSVAHSPTPDNISRYIDRILKSEDQQREILTFRLVKYISWGHYSSWWPYAVVTMRERLNVDLEACRRKSRCEVVYFEPAGEVA